MALDDHYYSHFCKDLKRIGNRLASGVADATDQCVAAGIINLLLESNNPEICEQAKNFVERNPGIKNLVAQSSQSS
jgi:hypothetical protein